MNSIEIEVILVSLEPLSVFLRLLLFHAQLVDGTNNWRPLVFLVIIGPLDRVLARHLDRLCIPVLLLQPLSVVSSDIGRMFVLEVVEIATVHGQFGQFGALVLGFVLEVLGGVLDEMGVVLVFGLGELHFIDQLLVVLLLEVISVVRVLLGTLVVLVRSVLDLVGGIYADAFTRGNCRRINSITPCLFSTASSFLSLSSVLFFSNCLIFEVQLLELFL